VGTFIRCPYYIRSHTVRDLRVKSPIKMGPPIKAVIGRPAERMGTGTLPPLESLLFTSAAAGSIVTGGGTHRSGSARGRYTSQSVLNQATQGPHLVDGTGHIFSLVTNVFVEVQRSLGSGSENPCFRPSNPLEILSSL